MKPTTIRFALAIAAAFATAAQAQDTTDARDAAHLKQMGTVLVTGNRPSSLPTQIPTTIEGITALEIARTINATDAEDALKYLPSPSGCTTRATASMAARAVSRWATAKAPGPGSSTSAATTAKGSRKRLLPACRAPARPRALRTA